MILTLTSTGPLHTGQRPHDRGARQRGLNSAESGNAATPSQRTPRGSLNVARLRRHDPLSGYHRRKPSAVNPALMPRPGAISYL